MATVVVLGSQWGDEGKGKIVDMLSSSADAVVRFQGGNNAGHTVYQQDQKKVLHLLPSSIISKSAISIIANGVVIDPVSLCSELDTLNSDWSEFYDRLYISDRAHIVTNFHKHLDIAREKHAGVNKIGTTKRGIGPCYEDKVSRRGLRVGDFADLKHAHQRFMASNSINNQALKLYDSNAEQINLQAEFEMLSKACRKLQPFVTDTQQMLYQMYKDNKNILLEGAQGGFLDIDHGTYPFVTSSNTTVGAALSGSGLPPQSIDQVLAVTKCYNTRVGRGSFMTEIPSPISNKLFAAGKEFGATTGRKRRCGWLDLVQLTKATEINGFTSLVLTKLDVLDTFPEINICTSYKPNPEAEDKFDKYLPVYETLEGWQTNTSGTQDWQKLPQNAKKFIEFIVDRLKLEATIISTGVKRDDVIKLKDIY